MANTHYLTILKVWKCKSVDWLFAQVLSFLDTIWDRRKYHGTGRRLGKFGWKRSRAVLWFLASQAFEKYQGAYWRTWMLQLNVPGKKDQLWLDLDIPLKQRTEEKKGIDDWIKFNIDLTWAVEDPPSAVLQNAIISSNYNRRMMLPWWMFDMKKFIKGRGLLVYTDINNVSLRSHFKQ